MANKPLIMGNWKMHGNAAFASALLTELQEKADASANWAVLVPHPYLALAQSILNNGSIHWGAQNMHDQESGAFTGEVSASMLGDFGCRYVLVGHSERRALFGETDAWVVKKYKAALASGLMPVLCVGETLEQREDGLAEKTVLGQLEAVFSVLDEPVEHAIIAYEPVWAIGTGKTASAEQVGIMHACIRKGLMKWGDRLAKGTQILYGGSVKPDNAAKLLAVEHVDGALVGGASLDATSFLAIGGVCTPSF